MTTIQEDNNKAEHTQAANPYAWTPSQLAKVITSPAIGNVDVYTNSIPSGMESGAKSNLLTVLESMGDTTIILDNYEIVVPNGGGVRIGLPYKGEDLVFTINVTEGVYVGAKTLSEFKDRVTDTQHLDLSMLPDDLTDDYNIYFLQYNALYSLFVAHTVNEDGDVVEGKTIRYAKPVAY